MVINFKKIGSLIVVSLLLFLTGCYCTNRKNVSIEISNRFWDDTVYVDVACINDDMYSRYDMCSSEEYWGNNSDLRVNLDAESFIFNVNYPTKQKLSKDDPLWNDWKSDNYLIVLAKMPKPHSDIPWKTIIPLDAGCFSNHDIFVYLSEKGVVRLKKELQHSSQSHISDDNMRRFNENM